MDKDKTPGGNPPELEDILNEFAPLEGPAPEAPGAPEPPPAEEPKEAGPPRKEEPKAPPDKPAPPPEEEEVEEPTLRLISKDGRLVRAVPLGKETAERRPARTGREAEEAPTRRMPAAAVPGPAPAEGEEKKLPWWKRKLPPAPQPENDKIIAFPEEEEKTGLERLREKADAYAQGMFPDDEARDPEEELRNELLPGVDYEEEPTHAPRPRKKRKFHKPKPDLPPAALAKKLGRGMAFLHTRAFLALLVCLPQIYFMIYRPLGLPMLPALEEGMIPYQAAAIGLGVSALLALDVLGHGLLCLIRLRLESETVLLFAVAAATADALTMPVLGTRNGSMPYCAVVSAALFFALWSRSLKRQALRQSCRVAAAATEPYLVTLDEGMWNGRDAFSKWAGSSEGYGSQVQEPDGAQRCYHIAAPIIIIVSALLALVASVGQNRPELFFWSLSATLTAGCGFAGFLTYAMPFSSVTRRLSKVGGALGGWDGISWGKRGAGVILTDGDLFPPGSVTLNGIKLVGETSVETLASYAATLVRETGSGMEKPFCDLLRTQGGVFRRCSGVVFHEGGVTGTIGGRQVYVGSGAFMAIMKISLPQGLNVKNAVFCAVDGELEGIFALNYRLHQAVRPSIAALLANKLDPILATRDFAIIPEMLRRKFKLPADRMDFPNLDRRRDLSSKRQEHADELAAVLCREGLEPYAEAVVGGKRLARSTRMGLVFALLGAAAGMGLAFYLTAACAFAALSAEAMLIFLLLWMVPEIMVAGWANRY